LALLLTKLSPAHQVSESVNPSCWMEWNCVPEILGMMMDGTGRARDNAPLLFPPGTLDSHQFDCITCKRLAEGCSVCGDRRSCHFGRLFRLLPPPSALSTLEEPPIHLIPRCQVAVHSLQVNRPLALNLPKPVLLWGAAATPSCSRSDAPETCPVRFLEATQANSQGNATASHRESLDCVSRQAAHPEAGKRLMLDSHLSPATCFSIRGPLAQL
jgi:hypothetical protein